MWPDRLAEEQRRGLTIDLGFAWTELDGRQLAFVDVPGHERFVTNMLAGSGAMPPDSPVLFVVAATEGWMPQSEEHLAALDALRVRHALLVISKADLADPGPAIRAASERFATTSMADPFVALGTELDQVRTKLLALTDRLPEPDRDADVRLWVDRAFTVRGAGTVVTGTLSAGTIRVGDELEHAGQRVTVRGLQSLGRDHTEVAAVARVALNLRGVDRRHIARGDTVRTPGAWLDTTEIDVSLRSAVKLHRELVAHLGSAAVPVYVRALGAKAARLRLSRPLPLRVGDIGLLRDPGQHRIAAGIEVLDVAPPSLRRRGAARERARELAGGRIRHSVRGPRCCARWGCRSPDCGWAIGWSIRSGGPPDANTPRQRSPTGPPTTMSRRGCHWKRCASKWGYPPPSWFPRCWWEPGWTWPTGWCDRPARACQRGSTRRCAPSKDGWPPNRFAPRKPTNWVS